jgi:hypothetical protein
MTCAAVYRIALRISLHHMARVFTKTIAGTALTNESLNNVLPAQSGKSSSRRSATSVAPAPMRLIAIAEGRKTVAEVRLIKA